MILKQFYIASPYYQKLIESSIKLRKRATKLKKTSLVKIPPKTEFLISSAEQVFLFDAIFFSSNRKTVEPFNHAIFKILKVKTVNYNIKQLTKFLTTPRINPKYLPIFT